ncbi:WUSCHEL-related homeobox 11-like isoform X2 [Tripterygium wilfordii]|uniref:WUSCHEL-related homeobox 11-like isoform X2 n=1 Tax=Tripterygium wilfordii TaxID=458696 RepID=UPI0018F821EA|nr:WUSCHEL-related homeobox 11-like isoform X2 [Tripterygium wilfordii]
MEDGNQQQEQGGGGTERSPPPPQAGSSQAGGGEPVRSRWTPKPEQILILESIFNSGMVNPPKDETVRIRKLLEKFGAVGDANVFYWFQNRRSRSRRRQRQLQASLAAAEEEQRNLNQTSNTSSSSSMVSFMATPQSSCYNSLLGGSSSSCGVISDDHGVENLYSITPQMGFHQDLQEQSSGGVSSSILCTPETTNLHYHSVFINGVPTEVPRGPLDMKAMFGDHQDVILVHSSGVPVLVNEFGFLMGLQHGESYFLVSRQT